MTIEIIILVIVSFNFFLAVWIYFQKKKRLINKLFSVLSFNIGLWVIALYFYEHPIIFSSLIWIKIAYFIALLLVFFVFYFSFVFPTREIKNLIIPLSLAIISALPLIYLLFFTEFWIKDVLIQEGKTHTILGPLYLPSIIYSFIFICWTLYNLIKRYLVARGIEKLQLKYIILGISLAGLGAGIVDGVIPVTTGSTGYFWLSPIFLIFLVGSIVLAITKYHLFEIRVILTELLVGAIGLISLIQALLVEPLWMKILGFGIFILFCIFGYLLIQATHHEIRRREEVEKLSSAKSEFISIASHQLRTPLNAIKGYISMILEGTYGKLPEKAKKPIENVYESNERLIKLVNDLLNISRIETGKIEMKFKKISLDELITNIVEDFKNEAEKKNIYLKWEKPKKTLAKILVDRDKIREVISNVVDNAIRYTNKGGVTIQLKALDKREQIKVSDTGVGMTKDELSKIFESFSRGAAGTRLYTEGVGLGLYVARKFVEIHNGRIRAESEGKGKGSIFYVELPIK